MTVYIIVAFIVGWAVGVWHTKYAASYYSVTDFRQRRRIALRRISKEYYK